jgi:triacylglycerol esterase/lipase EstA (alpha/beta hydrolase family)
MGQKLAIEIIQFMKDESLLNTNTKVNFIGFSLGGIIARASLPHLQNIHFGRYTSISSPHLGCSGS